MTAVSVYLSSTCTAQATRSLFVLHASLRFMSPSHSPALAVLAARCMGVYGYYRPLGIQKNIL